MRIIAYLQSVVMRFINIEELLPLGSSAIAPFMPAIVERYQFSYDENSNQLIGGTLKKNDEDIAILSFEIQQSRLISTCSTTEQSLIFLDDIVKFMQDSLKCRAAANPIPDFVSSAIVVDFDEDFLQKIVKIKAILSALKEQLDKTAFKTEMHTQALRFSGVLHIDKSRIGVNYSLEERSGRPFNSNWMFSQAPLSTDLHEKFLNDLASIVES